MLLHERVYFPGEGICPYPKIVSLNPVFFPQLIAAFDYGPMRGAVGDDADLRLAGIDLGAWHERAGGLELAIQALQVVLVIIRTLAVLSMLVVAAAAREVRCSGMIRSRQGAVRNRVAIHVFVAREAAQTIEIFFGQDFPTVYRLGGIGKWLRHPIVHA